MDNVISSINKLKPSYAQESPVNCIMPKFYHLSHKKAHEISNFAPFVNKINQEYDNIRNAIDIGSGLVSRKLKCLLTSLILMYFRVTYRICFIAIIILKY